MQTGRKFFLTLLGMVMAFIVTMLGKSDTSAFFNALGALVLSFNGANAAISYAYARSEEEREDAETKVEGFRPNA